MTNIDQALIKLFDKHRIVFWYDKKQELHQEFSDIWLSGVEKIELKDNEFGIKHLILREKPNQKFLLYHSGKQPTDLQNWLLDIQLAHVVFHADQASLWLSDVGLGPEHWDLVQDHEEFFRSEARRAALRLKLIAQDTPNNIHMKMLAICVGEGIAPRLDELLEKLLEELSEDKVQSLETIHVCELDGFLWEQVQHYFNYQAKAPNLNDFVISLFQSSYLMGLGEKTTLNQEALVFLHRWKDSTHYKQAFEALSEKCAEILNIEADLPKHSIDDLIETDYFKLIDQRIISDLVKRVTNRTISANEISRIIRRRRTTHWYGEYQNVYEAIDYAAQFQSQLEEADLTVQSVSEGVRKYSSTWYVLDQLYRKYIYHAQSSRQVSLLEKLNQLIDNLYTNNYLLKVNNNWQPIIDRIELWEAPPFILQRDFFDKFVRIQISNQKKVAVIVSDALRFEIGVELEEIVCRTDRFEADVQPLVSMLPSYTQLGMAALLPNASLTLNQDGTILVDGQSASGIDNRGKIINNAISASKALRADEFTKQTRDEARALFRDHNIVHIYHNQIDLVGDKRESEERVFDAVESALNELFDMVKKLANANYTTIIVTSDHGFIYQNRALEESDYAVSEVAGENILYRDRRFVIGTGLQKDEGIRKFTTDQLGLQGDLEIAIPKSIQRLRLKGSGSRYVHGGATLQETVIPVVQIRKKRESDIDTVEIDILRSASATISTGQLTVSFYQDEPVTSKMQARKLLAAIYSQNGELISDQHQLIFDLTFENPRQREVQVRFILSRKADEINGQEVILKLEEPVEGTSYNKEYKTARYLLQRSFTSDFDF